MIAKGPSGPGKGALEAHAALVGGGLLSWLIAYQGL